MNALVQEAALRQLKREEKAMVRRLKVLGEEPKPSPDDEISDYDREFLGRAVRVEIDVCVPLASAPGGVTLEYELHRRFAAQRSHGEWFHPSEALAAVIAASPVQYGAEWRNCLSGPKGMRPSERALSKLRATIATDPTP